MLRNYYFYNMAIFTINFWFFSITPTWYWLMYALSFLVFYFFIKKGDLTEKNQDILLFYTLLWVIIGGRVWYVLLYNFEYYRVHLWEIFMPWKGGMSFHGGAIGVILAWYFVAKKIHSSFLRLSDTFVWIVPIGLFLGRIGNYINGELFGLPGYTGIGARTINGVSYFPTPLLEGLLEWIVLGWILLAKRKRVTYSWQLGVWFLWGYALMRFMTEFLRTPDIQIGYIAYGWVTIGHILSLVMFITSIILHLILVKKPNH